MLWRGRRESGNIEDRRGMGGGALGIGALLIGAALTWVMGGNPLAFIAQNIGTTSSAPVANEQVDNDRKSFASVVLADTEDVWTKEFSKISKTYPKPTMVLFRGRVDSACGSASSAVGPFYCPGDQKVYLDLSFFDDLSQKLGAKGDFAGAYVVAHEVGHHVQTVLGLEGLGGRSDSYRSKNEASVQFELQADCLAGVWAKQTQDEKNVIESGDIDEALATAEAIGDDRLQRMSQGEVVPDSFTHGSSAQRKAAFAQGYNGGRLETCR